MITRRHLLQLGGLTALGVGLPAGTIRAFAQSSEPTRRLVVISHCHGWPYATWKMRPTGMSEAEPWTLDLNALAESDFSRPLAPLYEHRRRLLALDGLSLATAELDSGGNRHDRGWIHAWTGNNADFAARDTRSISASIDQLVAGHVARPDRLPSLELSVDAALEAGRPIAYNPGGVRLPAEGTPLRAWERVFGPASSGDAVGTRRRTTLDFAYDEYRELAPKIDSTDRARLESHFGLVERLGYRLEGLATLSCDAPPRPAAEFERYDRRFDAFADIIAAAFSCDITRVVSLSLGEMPTAEFGAAAISDKVHKGIAHFIYDDAKKHAAMTDYVEYHAGQVARLVSTLEAIPGRRRWFADGQHSHRVGVRARRRVAWLPELLPRAHWWLVGLQHRALRSLAPRDSSRDAGAVTDSGHRSHEVFRHPSSAAAGERRGRDGPRCRPCGPQTRSGPAR